jgi:hypothetical protein
MGISFKQMGSVLLVASALLVTSVGAPQHAAARTPPVETDGVATGGDGHMHMLLEKTFLGVDVMTIDVHFGPATAKKIAALVEDKSYDEDLAEQIVRVAARATDVYVVMEFKRNVTRDQFLDGARDNLKLARDAGMISAKNYKKLLKKLPRALAFLGDRGIKEGDTFYYRARAGSLQRVVLDKDGEELSNRTDRGSLPRLAMLAGYFAPDTDTREPLIQSLFD